MEFLVNTTFFIHDSLYSPLIAWLKENYLTALVDFGSFSDPIITEIMVKSDPDTTGIALQFKSPNLSTAEKWLSEIGESLHQTLMNKFPDKLLLFTTFMKILT